MSKARNIGLFLGESHPATIFHRRFPFPFSVERSVAVLSSGETQFTENRKSSGVTIALSHPFIAASNGQINERSAVWIEFIFHSTSNHRGPKIERILGRNWKKRRFQARVKDGKMIPTSATSNDQSS